MSALAARVASLTCMLCIKHDGGHCLNSTLARIQACAAARAQTHAVQHTMAQTRWQFSRGLAAALVLLFGCLCQSAAAASGIQEGRRLLQAQSRVVVTKLSSGSHCDPACFCRFCRLVMLIAATQTYPSVYTDPVSYQSATDAGAGSLAAAAAAAAAASAAANAGAAAGTLPIYDLVEYIGTSGSTLTSTDIGNFPLPPSNVKLTWVVAFIGDATSSSTPSGNFGCTGGSFCSGSDLDQGLVSALKGFSNAKVLTPSCLLPSICCKPYM